jgi:heme exporter protein C
MPGMSDIPAPAGLMRAANPGWFLAASRRALPWLAGATALAFALASWLVATSPADDLHGRTVLIMFVHVPAAWLGLGLYVAMGVSSLGVLVWRHPLADVAASAMAPIGAAMTALCLVTGSIWGRPSWGTWWEWDARMTSMLLLLLIYLGVVALRRSLEDQSLAARATAILTLVGLVNIPIIRFSVDWWWTLHQPASVLRLDGPTIHVSLLMPLLAMAAVFALFAALVQLLAMRAELHRRRTAGLHARRARVAPRGGIAT